LSEEHLSVTVLFTVGFCRMAPCRHCHPLDRCKMRRSEREPLRKTPAHTGRFQECAEPRPYTICM